jgi:hypothetical protein
VCGEAVQEHVVVWRRRRQGPDDGDLDYFLKAIENSD